jgi:thiosulfate dehydrogenase [quinone] large subunit
VTRPSASALALLPIRFFFGATFLWAGLDKLLDPTFLDPTSPASLHAQLVAFARFSPLGGLIQASLPFTLEIGLLIAVAEIGIGVGALSGLAFRVAAVGGMLLSLLFWLTASWTVHPYYFGADLPYAAGWLALAIGGHGGLLVPERFRERSGQGAGASEAFGAASPERRLLLETATLAAVSAIVASLTLPLRAAGLVGDRSAAGGIPGSTAGPSPGPSVGPSTTPAPTIPDNAIPIARIADVSTAGSAAFVIPFDAPPPLPAGDPGVIVQLADGRFVAFDAVCTHAGCTVEWDRAQRLLICPCHDAVFDASSNAAVLAGPATTPLATVPIVIDVATGRILLVPDQASGAVQRE